MKKSTCLFRGLASAVLAATLLLNSGCFLLAVAAVGAAAAGTVAYVDGKLEATLGNRYEAVVSATNSAITQLGFAKPEERKDELTDTLTTHTSTGKQVIIVLTKDGDASTKVSIRIDTMGDQAMSQSILDKIKANL
jgi:hypothetical protein